MDGRRRLEKTGRVAASGGLVWLLALLAAEGGAQATPSPTRIARGMEPDWSPDGSRLVYMLVTEGRGNDRVMLISIPAELHPD